ncbi:MAG: hypothetical protein ACFHU9_01585 [Fluviicola sp.]
MKELDSLEAYRINFQSVYHNQSNSMALCLNLLEFAQFQFKSTYLYQNQDRLKEVCNSTHSFQVNVKSVEGFLTNALIDDIKVSISFENLLKAFLLCNYYVVHELDRNILPELWKIQKERPLLFTEVLEYVDWFESDKINTTNRQLKNQVRGIKNKTIQYSIILNNTRYREIHNIDDEIINLLNLVNNRRNELHLQSSLQFQITNSTYSNFIILKDFLEKNIKRLQEDISAHLGINEQDRVPTMKISRS